jgi:hypothetical protein
MARVNDDNWLDEALDKAIGSADTRPDFEAWKARHPDAVQELTSRTPQQPRSPVITRIAMNGLLVKLAAAAAIIIAGIVGITQLNQRESMEQATILSGPMNHTFADGSVVALTDGARIRTYGQAGRRGFEHLAGAIDVTVAKGKGEFIVTTAYGDVKALGTPFTMDLVDGVADTGQQVQLLAVEVSEGKVEVRNAKGATTLKARQDAIVGKDTAPYDFRQDQTLPARLKERIGAMVAAFAAGDRVAWAANFNFDYLFKLAKGQVQYDPLRFGGNEEDAKRLGEMAANITSPEEMSKAFLGAINIGGPTTVYVRQVTLSADGAHAKAECVTRKTDRGMTIIWPQWHHFDNDWWQIDD